MGLCDVELPPFLPKGSPVELTYEYNANQVLEVAVDACGNQAKVSIERNTGLAPDEVERATAASGRHLRSCEMMQYEVSFPVPLAGRSAQVGWLEQI